jgi:hypothetical protein
MPTGTYEVFTPKVENCLETDDDPHAGQATASPPLLSAELSDSFSNSVSHFAQVYS